MSACCLERPDGVNNALPPCRNAIEDEQSNQIDAAESETDSPSVVSGARKLNSPGGELAATGV